MTPQKTPFEIALRNWYRFKIQSDSRYGLCSADHIAFCLRKMKDEALIINQELNKHILRLLPPGVIITGEVQFPEDLKYPKV